MSCASTPSELDLARFERLREEARRAEPTAAARKLREALALSVDAAAGAAAGVGDAAVIWDSGWPPEWCPHDVAYLECTTDAVVIAWRRTAVGRVPCPVGLGCAG